MSLGRTQSRAYAVISTGDHSTNEVYLLPMNDFAATPVLVSPRKTNREYNVDERGGTLTISSEGTTTITYFAIDIAGNAGVALARQQVSAVDPASLFGPVREGAEEVGHVAALAQAVVKDRCDGGLDLITVQSGDTRCAHRMAS